MREPAAVVISSVMLNASVMGYLTALPRVAGVVVLDDSPTAAELQSNQLSPDRSTPHGAGTPDASTAIGPTYAWNPFGSGVAYEDYSIPVVLATGGWVSLGGVTVWAP